MYVYRGEISWSDKFRNEGITVLFPTTMTSGDPVYLFSQWSTIPDGFDSKAIVGRGIIGPSDGTPQTVTLSFSTPGGSVNLFAAHSADNKIVLRWGTKDVATLSLAFHESGIHPYHQRIYKGKLDFEVSVEGKAHKAIDETLFAFTVHEGLESERLICAFWQWTEAHETKNINANFVSSSNSNTPQLVDKNLVLTLKRGLKVQGQQVLLMQKANEETHKFEVALARLADTIKVTNDLDTFVQCNIQAKLSSTVSNIFTWIGMGLAVAGIPLAIALPPAGGVAFALGGFAAAEVGTLWAYMTPEEAKYPAMAPGAILESSVIIGSFDVFVMRLLQSGTALAVQSAFITDQSGAFNLSTITDWKDIIRLDAVLGTRTLATRAFLTIKGLATVPSGSEVTDLNGNNNFGIYAYSKEGKPNYYGRIRTQDETPVDLFKKDSDSSVALLFAALSYGTVVKIERLTNGQLVLQMRSYTITGYSADDVVEIPADDVPGMLYNIAHDNDERLAYFTTSDDTPKFMAVKSTASDWTVQYQYPAVTTMVFLRVAKSPVINAIMT